MSRLVTEIILRQAGDDDVYRAAMVQAFEGSFVGFDLGGKVKATRDELHDRPALR